MPSTYTVNLGIEKPATGEQSGTWGDTTNINFDILDQAINGVLSLTLSSAGTSGSPNSLSIDDGATSDGRNKWIEFVDGGDLGANAYVQLVPNDAEKIVFFRNSLSGSRSVFVFQGTYSASNDFEIPAGYDVVLKFDGGGASATVTDVFTKLRVTELYTPTLGAGTADINDGTVEAVIGGTTPKAGTFTTLTGNTNLTINATTTVDGILDEDNMASDSATKLATQQSIKAYVDSQVGTIDTLSEILANGNTSGANNLIIDNGQALTSNTINETTADTGVTVESVLLKDGDVTLSTGDLTVSSGDLTLSAGDIINTGGSILVGNASSIGVGGAIKEIQNHGTDASSGLATTRFSADSSGTSVVLGKSRSASIGSYSAITSGDAIGFLIFAGDDGTDLNTQVAYIKSGTEGTIATNQIPGTLELWTANSSGTMTQGLVVDSSQNVDIPNGDLDLVTGGLYADGATNYLGQTHIGDTSNTGTLSNQLTISDTNSTASIRIRFQNSEGGFDLGSDNGSINFYGNLGAGNPVLFQIDDSTGDVNVLSGDITVSNRFETKQVTIADDSYSPVTPPRNGGFCIFTFGGDSTTPGNTSSALFYYDVGTSLAGSIQTSISTNVTIANAARTGTDGPNGSMNIGIQSGVIHFENRVGLTKNIQITFL